MTYSGVIFLNNLIHLKLYKRWIHQASHFHLVPTMYKCYIFAVTNIQNNMQVNTPPLTWKLFQTSRPLCVGFHCPAFPQTAPLALKTHDHIGNHTALQNKI